MANSPNTEAAKGAARNAALTITLEEKTTEEVASGWELDVINDAEHGRWIAVLGAEAIGELAYRFAGGRIVLLSTWVSHAYRNQGVATELIARVLDEIRLSGEKITIICPVVGDFIARNTQYLDLIDRVHLGSGAYPKHHLSGIQNDNDEVNVFHRELT